ncbi:hypothetical protein ACFO1B_47640 [Dactylosporangium siamense]|uniref:Uncharacterized protein n=1 Tax=Dactylosporangium siamense TaxID=685454 RepID=A0A919UDJ3_9ACTN|nr:hypothetical protein [Dactylosporangium siamense]GIG51522.1 hypothetical protein Dsi01nite_095630 [Dactylosporangium siamense]
MTNRFVSLDTYDARVQLDAARVAQVNETVASSTMRAESRARHTFPDGPGWHTPEGT